MYSIHPLKKIVGGSGLHVEYHSSPQWLPNLQNAEQWRLSNSKGSLIIQG